MDLKMPHFDGMLDREAERRFGAMGPDRACPHRIVALISEKPPAFNPRSMILKKTALQAAAAGAGCAIGAYVIDVLPSTIGEVYAPPVCDLVHWARSGALDAIVLGGLDDLSMDHHAAFFAAVLLAENGVRVIEAGRPSSHPAASRSGMRDRRSDKKAASEPPAWTVAR